MYCTKRLFTLRTALLPCKSRFGFRFKFSRQFLPLQLPLLVDCYLVHCDTVSLTDDSILDQSTAPRLNFGAPVRSLVEMEEDIVACLEYSHVNGDGDFGRMSSAQQPLAL